MCLSKADIGPPGAVTSSLHSGCIYWRALMSSLQGSSTCSITSEHTACVAHHWCSLEGRLPSSRLRCRNCARGTLCREISTPERLSSSPSNSAEGDSFRSEGRRVGNEG